MLNFGSHNEVPGKLCQILRGVIQFIWLPVATQGFRGSNNLKNCLKYLGAAACYQKYYFLNYKNLLQFCQQWFYVVIFNAKSINSKNTKNRANRVQRHCFMKHTREVNTREFSFWRWNIFIKQKFFTQGSRAMDARDHLDREDILTLQLLQNRHSPCCFYSEGLY